ncbi:MAG: hypothetical protein ABFD60_11150 [Bryobacteraceae bacterium]
MNGNHWRIQIGVTLAGELLIGAAKIRAAEDGDGVAETATIWPSQLEHRCAAHVAKLLFDPEKKGDRWILLTPREAYMRQEAGNVDLIRRFPAARGNFSIRRRKDVK